MTRTRNSGAVITANFWDRLDLLVDPMTLHQDYQRANRAAYAQLMAQMQQNPNQAAFATAFGGTFVATPRAEVVVESITPTVTENLRKRKGESLVHWLMIAVLSIVSIWPAWGPQSLAATFKPHHQATMSIVLPKFMPAGAWRYFKITMKNGNVVHAPGDHFVKYDDGGVEIKTQYEIVYTASGRDVGTFEEETWGQFPGSSPKSQESP